MSITFFLFFNKEVFSYIETAFSKKNNLNQSFIIKKSKNISLTRENLQKKLFFITIQQISRLF